MKLTSKNENHVLETYQNLKGNVRVLTKDILLAQTLQKRSCTWGAMSESPRVFHTRPIESPARSSKNTPLYDVFHTY